MNVLHLITSSPGFFEQQIQVLESRGVDCTILNVPGEYRADSPRTVGDYLRYYPRVLAAVRDGDFDLVHAHYGLVGPFALAQPSRPVVLTLWGTDLMSEMAWLRGISRVGAKLVDTTILPSKAMADTLGTEFELVPFGVDTELFRPIPQSEARERLGWESDGLVALFPYDPARPEKNYALAEHVVEATGIDIELRAVTGRPYEEMPLLMNASDLLLITSNRESGPMTVKEAAACNLPVVSTDVGFVRDTIGDVPNCAVCTSKAELITGIEHVLGEGHRTNSRHTVDGLGLEEMGQRLMSVYRDAAEPASSGVHTALDPETHGI